MRPDTELRSASNRLTGVPWSSPPDRAGRRPYPRRRCLPPIGGVEIEFDRGVVGVWNPLLAFCLPVSLRLSSPGEWLSAPRKSVSAARLGRSPALQDEGAPGEKGAGSGRSRGAGRFPRAPGPVLPRGPGQQMGSEHPAGAELPLARVAEAALHGAVEVEEQATGLGHTEIAAAQQIEALDDEFEVGVAEVEDLG